MDHQSSAATEATDASSQTTSQDTQAAPGRTYSQQEFDDAMAKMKAAVTKKAMRPLEELGDIEELRTIKQDFERKKQEEQVKRGEFEKILQDMAAKKDQEIARRDKVIQEYRVDTPIINAAAQLRSVNPEQVRSLLKSQVRLNGDGEVEVIDHATGSVRYGDSGTPIGVQDLVREFLDANPHFVQPTPATTNSKSSINGQSSKVDITKLDMKNPEHRKIYAEHRKTVLRTGAQA